MEVNKEIGTRLATIRKEFGLKQAEYAEVIGISRGLLSGLEKGHSNLTERNIKAVCKAYSINEKWLKTGEGDKFNTSFDQDKLENEEERDLIRMFRRLTAETKRMVVEIVRKFMNSSKIEDTSTLETDRNWDNGQADDKSIQKGA